MLQTGKAILSTLRLVSAIFLKLKIHEVKNVDEIAIITNVYPYEHYQKTKALCRHVSYASLRLLLQAKRGQ